MIPNMELSHLLLHTKDYAFCHIPKNGGTNFKHCFGYNREMPWWCQGNTRRHLQNWRHQRPSWFEKTFDIHPKQWICIVRNPYSRYVSMYAYFKRRGVEVDTDRWCRPENGRNMWLLQLVRNCTFEEFVHKNVPKLVDNFILQWRHRNYENEYKLVWALTDPQVRWVKDVPNMKWFKLEEPHILEEYSGLTFSDTFMNMTPHDPWESYYSPELKQIIYERFTEDFDFFGYDRGRRNHIK